MSERISKCILAVEALLLAVPITFLFLIWFSVAISSSRAMDRIAAVVVGVALFAGWRLMTVFWRHGASALQDGRIWIWIAAAGGAIIAMVVGLLLLITDDDRVQRFGVVLTGLPLLVPFAHLLAERRFRSIASASLQTRPIAGQAGR